MYDSLKTLLATPNPGTVLFSAIAFLFFAVLIWHLTAVLNGAKESTSARSTNRLVAMLGGLCGWIIGIAFAPFSEAEKSQFAAISSVVSAFLSGYVVSKVDRFVEGTLFPISEAPKASWSRVGLFAATLLLASVTVFVNRLYAFQGAAAISGQADDRVSAAFSGASAVAAALEGAKAGSSSVVLPRNESPPACWKA